MRKAAAHGKFKVALCQMNSGDDVDVNLVAAESMLKEASKKGASLVCLPELFTCMCASYAQKEKAADSKAQETLANVAKRHKVRIAAGSIHVRGSQRLFNRSLLIDHDGNTVASYDKIHLFRYKAPDREYDEGKEFEMGSKPVAVDTELGRIGLSVCYDLRFPELYRMLGKPDILLVPSAFTVSTGKAHWEILLRARAIENQCYVLAAAQCGEHPGGIKTYGHSMAVDPWGQIIASLDDKPGIAMAEIDFEKITACRERLPALDNRAL